MPQGDKSSYSSKQRREAHHIEKSYEKRGVSKGEAESRAWATVNKQDGGAKGKSSSHSGHKSGSHKSSSGHKSSSSHKSSGHHSGHRKSSRSHHSSRSGSKRRSSGRSRSRSRGFSMFGLKLPEYTPYVLGGLGICGLIYGLMQIDVISDAIDSGIDDVAEFFGLTDRQELMADRSLESSMSTIH